jgi:hypothetical protein
LVAQHEYITVATILDVIEVVDLQSCA